MANLKTWLSRFAALGFLVNAAAAQAAYLTDVPITLEQPDGTEVSLLASGDEFYNWVHDADGYVLVRNPETGWIVYAREQGGQIVPTETVVGTVDPAAAGFTPGIFPDNSVIEARRAARAAPQMAGSGPEPVAKTGTLNNLVIYIRFADQSEFTTPRSTYQTLFNGVTGNSLYAYYREASYDTLFINSTMYPVTTGATVISYQDIYPRNYYRVYDAVTNPDGYLSGQTASREHALLERAVASIAGQVPTDLNIDTDNDGYIDSIAFIIQGPTEGWAELLWPHAWSLYTRTVRINGKRIGSYSFQLENSTLSSGVGVLAHETGHTLGMPDLYRYKNDQPNNPIGGWDVMASNQNPPQHMSAYMKWRYMKWIPTIPEITTSGVYTLNPLVSPTGNCYMIRSPYSTTEYFVLEYRRKVGVFENKIPAPGLVVYRINTLRSGSGNANGPPDEIYVYRPNGTMTSNGSINSASFTSTYGRTRINDTTNPSSFLSNGGPGGLSISEVGALGETISFRVTIQSTLKFAAFYGVPRDQEVFPFTVRVALMDINGQTVTEGTHPVTLSLAPGTGAPDATLQGTTTVDTVNGIATFSDLSIDKPGTGYKLVATAPDLPSAESTAFDVAPFSFTMFDALEAMFWASGFHETPADRIPRWDVVTDGDSAGRVDLADVSAIVRKATGLAPNP